MAITYPRDLPDILLKAPRFRFDYEPLGSGSRSAGGAVSFQERAGGSLWEMMLQSMPLREGDYGIADGWFKSLRGGAHTFKGYDLRRCHPLAYGLNLPATRHDATAFNGTCTVTAAGGITISLSGLPSTYALTVGDYVSFPWRGSQVLVKALESRAAALGVITGLVIGPWLLAGGTAPATATLVRAWCLMKPMPGTWSGERNLVDPVSFEAIQALA